MNAKQTALLEKIEATLDKHGVSSPSIEDLSFELGLHPNAVKAIIILGLQEGKLIKIGDDLYYTVKTLEELKKVIKAQYRKKGPLTVSDTRDLLKASRRYAHQILTYLYEIEWIKPRENRDDYDW